MFQDVWQFIHIVLPCKGGWVILASFLSIFRGSMFSSMAQVDRDITKKSFLDLRTSEALDSSAQRGQWQLPLSLLVASSQAEIRTQGFTPILVCRWTLKATLLTKKIHVAIPLAHPFQISDFFKKSPDKYIEGFKNNCHRSAACKIDPQNSAAQLPLKPTLQSLASCMTSCANRTG